MPFRATLKKLIRRDATAPSLRERAAELRGSLTGQTRRTVVAGSVLATVPLPALAAPVLLIKQAEAARDETRTYAEMLAATAARLLAAGAAAVLADNTNSGEDSQTTAEGAPSTHREEAPQPIAVNLIDPAELASATLEDLSTLLDTADLVGSVAYAAAWQGRCSVRGASHQHGAHHNVAGKLLQRLGDALTRVEYAAEREAASRVPTNPSERATRLSMLAVPTIDNDDPDVIAAFARELADHAEAEREGR